MSSFNALDEPWIPVLTHEGKAKEVGIREAIYHASDYSKIREEDPLQKIAIIRLLTAFLSDAYHLESRSDRRKLLEKGSFDQEVIERYICHCVDDCGASFDLFDETRPFMVQKYDADKDVTVKSAANICVTAPSANNPLHFVHIEHANFKGLTPAQALRSVLSTYLFAPAMSGGYPSSVNNTPPVYYAPSSPTLFEQLVMCMRSTRELGNISLDSVPASWNSSERVFSGKKISEVSFLSAMTFESRRIVLIQDEDGKIRKCYFSPGIDFKGNDLWKDPFVSYVKNKDGKFITVKPQEGRDLWRDVGNITAARSSIPPSVLYPLREDRNENVFSVGLITNQALMVQVLVDQILIPQKLMEDEDLSDQIVADMSLIESLFRKISAYKDSHGDWKGTFADVHDIVPDMQMIYLSETHNMLISRYFQEVADTDLNSEDWPEVLRKNLTEKLNHIIGDICQVAENHASSWKDIKQTEIALRNFRANVNYVLKESRGENE